MGFFFFLSFINTTQRWLVSSCRPLKTYFWWQSYELQIFKVILVSTFSFAPTRVYHSHETIFTHLSTPHTAQSWSPYFLRVTFSPLPLKALGRWQASMSIPPTKRQSFSSFPLHRDAAIEAGASHRRFVLSPSTGGVDTTSPVPMRRWSHMSQCLHWLQKPKDGHAAAFLVFTILALMSLHPCLL